MKILSDATTTSEVRVITLEDGPVILMEDGPGVFASTPGRQIRVQEIRVAVHSDGRWRAYVSGLKIKADGTPGRVRGELQVLGTKFIPDWLRDIASAADKEKAS